MKSEGSVECFPPSVRIKSSVLSIGTLAKKKDFFFFSPVVPTNLAVKKGNVKNLIYSHTNTKQEELVCKRLPVAKALPHPGCSHWYGLSPV